MNKVKRQPYFILTQVSLPDGNNPIMCSFCRYCECSGDCYDADFDCLHPLNKPEHCTVAIERVVNDAMDGSDDCFLFRPAFAPEVAADIVGIWLQGKEPDWETVPMLGRKGPKKPRLKEGGREMNFEEWKKWKESQTSPTCDYVGCRESAYWILPQSKVYFCVAHAAKIGGVAGMEKMYGERPVCL